MLDWLDDLEIMRNRSSNLQGWVSGRMRHRIAAVKNSIGILVSRAGDMGNTSYLQARNNELERANRSLQRDVTRTNEDLAASEEKVRKLEGEIREMRRRIGSSGSSSLEPQEVVPPSLRIMRRKKKDVVENSPDVQQKVDVITKQVLMVVNECLDKRMELIQASEERFFDALREFTRAETGSRNFLEDRSGQHVGNAAEELLPPSSAVRTEERGVLYRRKTGGRRNLGLSAMSSIFRP